MKKKCMALLLVLAMCLGLAPITAFAADSDFTIQNGVLTKYNGSGGTVVVPEGVVEIGERAFDGCKGLKEIRLPSSLRVIGAYAFCSSGLSAINITNGVTSIEGGAFLYCSELTSVSIPASVTEISASAFESCRKLEKIEVNAGNPAYCSIDGVLYSKSKEELLYYPGGNPRTAYVIPEGVQTIGKDAFYNRANLQSLTIPVTVTKIEQLAFVSVRLDIPLSIYYKGTKDQWNDISIERWNEGLDDCLIYDINDAPPDVVSYAVGGGSILFDKSTGTVTQSDKTVTNVVIPEFIAERRVTKIASNAFRNCTALKSVSLPTGLTDIGSYAFANCDELVKIKIPDGTVRIGESAFYDCDKLTSVEFPDTLTTIGDMAFQGCDLSRLELPESLDEVGHQAFADCDKLTCFAFPEECTFTHGKRILSWCDGLSAVYIPVTMKTMGAYEFDDCTKLTDIFYEGSKAQWDSIRIVTTCPPFSADSTIVIHYNATRNDFSAFLRGKGLLPPVTAMPTNDKLTADGRVQAATVYKIDGSNYFKIRDLAAILNGTGKQFEVGYDGTAKSVTAVAGKAYTPDGTELKGAPAGGNKTASSSNDTIYINGVKADVEVYKIDGSNYFKLRDLGKALNFYVGWTKESGMYIDTSKPYSDD